MSFPPWEEYFIPGSLRVRCMHSPLHNNEAVWPSKDVSFIKDLHGGGLSCTEPSLSLPEKAFSLSALSVLGTQNQSRCHSSPRLSHPLPPGTHGNVNLRPPFSTPRGPQWHLGAQRMRTTASVPAPAVSHRGKHGLGSWIVSCLP